MNIQRLLFMKRLVTFVVIQSIIIISVKVPTVLANENIGESIATPEAVQGFEGAAEDEETTFIEDETTVNPEETTVSPEEPHLLTEEEAAQYINENGLVEQASTYLINNSYLSPEQMGNLPTEAIYNVLLYQLTNISSTINLEQTYSILLSTYPDLGNEESKVMTEAEAKEYIETNNLVISYTEELLQSGYLNQYQLSLLPADAVYNALLTLLTSESLSENVNTVFQVISDLYPDVFVVESEIPTPIQESNPASEFIHNQKVQLGNKTYLIKRLFILKPEEAGNTLKDQYLLGIEIDYTNQSDQAERDYQDHWYINTNLTQETKNGAESLERATYHFVPADQEAQQEHGNQEEPARAFKELKPQESISQTLYYQMHNVEEDIVLDILSTNGSQQFVVSMEMLLKMPPQSATYYNKDLSQAGYIFDFSRLYIIFSDRATLSQLDQFEAETQVVDLNELSPEAQYQYRLLNAEIGNEKLQLLEIDRIVYELSGNMVGVRQWELEDDEIVESSIFMTFKGNDNRTTISNEFGDIYDLIN